MRKEVPIHDAQQGTLHMSELGCHLTDRMPSYSQLQFSLPPNSRHSLIPHYVYRFSTHPSLMSLDVALICRFVVLVFRDSLLMTLCFILGLGSTVMIIVINIMYFVSWAICTCNDDHDMYL